MFWTAFYWRYFPAWNVYGTGETCTDKKNHSTSVENHGVVQKQLRIRLELFVTSVLSLVHLLQRVTGSTVTQCQSMGTQWNFPERCYDHSHVPQHGKDMYEDLDKPASSQDRVVWQPPTPLSCWLSSAHRACLSFYRMEMLSDKGELWPMRLARPEQQSYHLYNTLIQRLKKDNCQPLWCFTMTTKKIHLEFWSGTGNWIISNFKIKS